MKLYHNQMHIGTPECSIHDPLLTWMCEKCKFHCQNTCHIKSGVCNSHIVDDEEVRRMEHEIEKVDLLSCFVDPNDQTKNPLDEDSVHELISQQPARVKNIPEFTQLELLELFGSLNLPCKDEHSRNLVSFHALSKAILLIRNERKNEIIRRAATSSDPVTNGPENRSNYVSTNQGLNLTKTNFTIHQCQEMNVLSKLLHNYTHQITANPADRCKSDFIHNVRLLRTLVPDNGTKWDGTCCVANTSKSSYVKSTKSATS